MSSHNQVQELTKDEHALLSHVHSAGRPVQVSHFFERMNTESGEQATARQLELYQVYVGRWKKDLIRVAIPANGREADQMVLTASGEASLQAAEG